jgi:predicted KAP-like P-loop ATPase
VSLDIHAFKIPLSTLVAFLRLGKKYKIEQLYLEVCDRLIHEFPSTLNSWDKVCHKFTLIDGVDGILFDMIALAREVNLQSILPAVFYGWCKDLPMSISNVFGGISW